MENERGMIKKSIQKVINRFGYTLSKTNQKKEFDLDLYEKLFSRESLENKCFYNIGAGKFFHPYWTNIDLRSDWYAESQKAEFVDFDLHSLKKLPVKSNSAEIVYSAHTVEHITNEASQNLFNEAYRILKPGGIFRFSTPDIDLSFRAYLAGDRAFFYWNKNHVSIGQVFLFQFASQFSTIHQDGATNKPTDEELARLFRRYNYENILSKYTKKCDLKIQYENLGNHINWWNENKAKMMLKKAGFQEIFLSGYGQSFSPILRNTDLFDNTHPKISLFMEVRK